MITAHLPSGYVLGRTAQRYGLHPWMMSAAIFGAILPDIDLIWFYFVDRGAFHHHLYWVHVPGYWALIAVATLLSLRAWSPQWLPPARVFFVAVFMHLLLDTIAGGIAWTWPLKLQLFQLIEVPPTHSHFVLSFLFHWTFSFELMIWAIAIYLYAKDKF